MADFDEGAHPRDENGRFASGEGDATAKSRTADAATARADQRDESLGDMSGVNAEHEAAATAHREAAEAHEKLAAKYTEAGDHDKAAEHEGQAEDHRGMVSAHETGAGRSIEYQNKVKAQQAAKNAARLAAVKVDPKLGQDPAKARRDALAANARARRIEKEHENTDQVRGNVEREAPHLLPLWEKLKETWPPHKFGPEERTTKFMERVHDMGAKEVGSFLDKHAEKLANREIRKMSALGQWAQKTSGRGPSVARASKRDGGVGTWAKQASGEVPF